MRFGRGPVARVRAPLRLTPLHAIAVIFVTFYRAFPERRRDFALGPLDIVAILARLQPQNLDLTISEIVSRDFEMSRQ